MATSCSPATAAALNIVLVPLSLRDLSQSQQKTLLATNTASMATLRCQIFNFWYILRRAKRYSNTGKCLCPYKVPWNVGGSLTLAGRCMAELWDYVADNQNSGFSYILFQVFQIVKNEENTRNMIQDGKASCGQLSWSCDM